MRTLLFAFVLLCTFPVHATIYSDFPVVKLATVRQDTAKIKIKVDKLNLKLTELKEEVNLIQRQIPADSVKLEKLLSKSHDELVKSKRKSETAIGGDADDAALAQKQAKKAAKQTKLAEQAADELERNHRKLKDLNKKIEKTQMLLTKIHTTAN